LRSSASLQSGETPRGPRGQGEHHDDDHHERDAPILVLDEATSALDSESENHIQRALWTLMQARTTIVIAHRLSTVRRMDRLVVLEAGAIVEQGRHDQLLAGRGYYAALWEHQSGGFLEELAG
jgi:ATP-binding cassette subfamily B protein